MTRLTDYLRPHYGRMSLGLFVKFIGSVMDLLLPWILAHLIDDIAPLQDIPLVWLWGGLMVVCAVLGLVLNVLANRMASQVSRNVTRRVRHDLFRSISYASCRQVDDFSVPSLISRLTSDTYNVHQMLGMVQRMGVRAPILLIGGILITLSLDTVLTLVLLAVLPLVTLLVVYISRKGIPLYKTMQGKVDALVRTVRENITGVRIIKALSKTEYEKERFAGVNEEVVRAETKAGVTMAATNPLMNLFLNLGLIGVILAGAYRVNWGLSEPGKIIAFLSYFTIILNAMLAVTRIFMIISKGSASFERIAAVLGAPEDLQTEAPDTVESPYHISFDHVSFSYHKNQNNLEDVSFGLKKGETLGIIGATGSGKSTLLKLLLRFYDADKGTIRINGRNIKCIPFGELHPMFGIVFQNDALFADTIGENVAFGRQLPPKEMAQAAATAQAEEFIDSLEAGWDHRLAIRGANLSGGQKQRVLLSRALAGSPEILLLDDSSSALDYNTDAALRRELRKNYGGTTTVIIAQRVSSIRHAHRILVLEEGRVIGDGTHEELLQSCPQYREISLSQMGGTP